MVNVAVQIDTLINHPLVTDAHRKGRLEVTGLFYDIASARVLQVTAADVRSFETQETA